MTLAKLTDAMTQALLGSTDAADIDAAISAGLMKGRFSYDDEGGDCEVVTFTDDARRLLAEAQRIAEGLTPLQVDILTGQADIHEAVEAYEHGVAWSGLREHGLIQERWWFDHEPTPAGRLVLALRERQR